MGSTPRAKKDKRHEKSKRVAQPGLVTRNAASSNTKDTNKVTKNTARIQRTPKAGTSKKRAPDSDVEDDSETQEGSSKVKYKRRYVEPSGEIHEVEVRFPSAFAAAHLDFVAKTMKSIKKVKEDD